MENLSLQLKCNFTIPKFNLEVYLVNNCCGPRWRMRNLNGHTVRHARKRAHLAAGEKENCTVETSVKSEKT